MKKGGERERHRSDEIVNIYTSYLRCRGPKEEQEMVRLRRSMGCWGTLSKS